MRSEKLREEREERGGKRVIVETRSHHSAEAPYRRKYFD